MKTIETVYTWKSFTDKLPSSDSPLLVATYQPDLGDEFAVHRTLYRFHPATKQLVDEFGGREYPNFIRESGKPNEKLYWAYVVDFEVKKQLPTGNSIMVIKPYIYEGQWVFDDPNKGLDKEALVAGVPQIIAAMLLAKGIAMTDAEQGFTLTFSAGPFPGFQLHAKHEPEMSETEDFGNWYTADYLRTVEGNMLPLNMKGWLCPALFKYFDNPPADIYASAAKIGS
jgi:hypothetical protein